MTATLHLDPHSAGPVAGGRIVHGANPDLTRRGALIAMGFAAATVLASCIHGTTSPTRTGVTDMATNGSTILLAFFSRPGENYYYGDRTNLTTGNTKVLAGMIRDRVGGDLYEITAAQPYSSDYDATVERNVQEQNDNARPGIDGSLPDASSYDVILLASPIWNVRPPIIMHTFADALDFTGKTVHPVVTYAVSGLGNAAQDYRQACPGARIGPGLAVRGETVSDSGDQIDTWLDQTGLARSTP